MRPLAITILSLAALGAIVLAVRAVRDDGAGQSGSVTMLGDSLNVGTEPYLADRLDGWRIAHDDVVGRTGQQGLDALRAMGSVAPVLVVSLGTNDPQDDPAGFRRLVEAVLREAGPRRCVVWSTIWLDGGPSETLNDVLRAAAARHPTLHLADWAGLVESTPGALAPDGIHGSPDGYAKRAEQVAKIVERCRPSAPVA